MAIVLGIPKSRDAKELRVPISAEVLKKLAALQVKVVIEEGAGTAAFIDQSTLNEATWVANAEEIYRVADVVWFISPPTIEDIEKLAVGTIVIGMIQPYASKELVEAYLRKQITTFALELLPRISRAQAMDVLSSQAAVAGYVAALLGAFRCPKFFPMLTYAAGTIRPAQVLVIGAGVAGLQAIATAKRLGAVVYGYDVRLETKEQVESLGAKFVDTGVSASGTGGYARELTAEEKAQQANKLAKAAANSDVIITTAAVPGKKAPLIITEEILAQLQPGTIVVDMAAESGGNVAGSIANKEVVENEVHILGPTHIPSRLAKHASLMLSKNYYNFFESLVSEGLLKLDWEDEVIAKTALTHDGRICNLAVAQALGISIADEETIAFTPLNSSEEK